MTPDMLTWNNFQFFGFRKQIILKKLKTKQTKNKNKNADIFVDCLCESIHAMLK